MRKHFISSHMAPILSIPSHDIFPDTLNVPTFQTLWLALLPDIQTHIKTMSQVIQAFCKEASMTDIVNVNQRCQILSYKIHKTSFSNKKHGYKQKIWQVKAAAEMRHYSHRTGWGFWWRTMNRPVTKFITFQVISISNLNGCELDDLLTYSMQ